MLSFVSSCSEEMLAPLSFIFLSSSFLFCDDVSAGVDEEDAEEETDSEVEAEEVEKDELEEEEAKGEEAGGEEGTEREADEVAQALECCEADDTGRERASEEA